MMLCAKYWPSITKSDKDTDSSPIIAAIDVGTNTIRLLIGRISQGRLVRIKTDRDVTRLGKGLHLTGHLDIINTELSISTLVKFKDICEQYGVARIIAVGTSALREAVDSNRFLRMVMERTGININVIPGDVEADLTIKGILANQWAFQSGIECNVITDIGGGSTELIMTGALRCKLSVPIGAVKLFERYIKKDPPSAYEISLMIETVGSALRQALSINNCDISSVGCHLIATGGTPTTLAAMYLNMERYDGDKVNGIRLPYSAIKSLYEKMVILPMRDRMNIVGLESSRADIIVPGAAILISIMNALSVDEVAISDFGLLEGIVYEQLAMS